jgi:hypothetical protein
MTAVAVCGVQPERSKEKETASSRTKAV